MLVELVVAALNQSPMGYIQLPSGPKIELIRIAGNADLPTFWIGKFEIRNDQYRAFIQETGYDGSDHPSSKTNEPFLADWKKGSFPAGKAAYPAAYLNWHHSTKFCVWLSQKSGRKVALPTQAQWYWAAAGAQKRKFPWGMEWAKNRCNIGGASDGFAESAPVGSFPLGATPEGVHDMAGNIWEWTSDGFLRGGPWCMGPETVECDSAADEGIDRADDKFGFRIVVTD